LTATRAASNSFVKFSAPPKGTSVPPTTSRPRALTRSATSPNAATTGAGSRCRGSPLMSLMPNRTTTAHTPGTANTSRSNRERASGLTTPVSSRLELMPAFTTPSRAGPGRASSRRAS